MSALRGGADVRECLPRGSLRFTWAIFAYSLREEVSPRSYSLRRAPCFAPRFPGSLSVFHAPGLLLLQGCANLYFCAVERAEWQCVRAIFRTPGGFPGGMGWRSSAGRASDL